MTLSELLISVITFPIIVNLGFLFG